MSVALMAVFLGDDAPAVVAIHRRSCAAGRDRTHLAMPAVAVRQVGI